jgi:hypothetical protein
MWNLILVHLETMLLSVQDRCMPCAKRTTSSEIILYAPDGTLGCEAQVEDHFSPFHDSAHLDTRWVHGLR